VHVYTTDHSNSAVLFVGGEEILLTFSVEGNVTLGLNEPTPVSRPNGLFTDRGGKRLCGSLTGAAQLEEQKQGANLNKRCIFRCFTMSCRVVFTFPA